MSSHDALFVALADDTHVVLIEMQPRQAQVDQFAHAQAAAIHHLQHGSIAMPFRVAEIHRVEDGLHFGDGEDGGKVLA